MHPAEQYIDGVLSGRLVVSRFVRLAVERHVRDLKTGAARGLFFDRKAAEHSIDFYGFLHHSKGEWAGKTFNPSPWQQFIRWCVFGWRRRDGTRRFREVYEEVARKNGKSTDLAGAGIYLFAADGEAGAEVYTAATKRDQARITHSEATRMVKASPALRKSIRCYRDNLNIPKNASKFEPLGADADTMDGLNVHGAIVDELHAHKTRDICDVLETATGSRRQPLIWYITTAGIGRESICWEKREYARKVLMGIIEDDGFFGIIFTIDLKTDWPELYTEEEAKTAGIDGPIEDRWNNPKVWIKSNPNLGISVKLDDLARMAKKAGDMPAAMAAFLRLRLNVWTSQNVRWVPMTAWDANAIEVNAQQLKGKTCYGALDLSSTTDLSALVLVFPWDKDFKVLPFFWIPADNMRERIKRDKVPYDAWAAQGLITPTPGNVIDYDFIVAKLAELKEIFDLRELAYDPWNATKLVQDLQKKEGMTLVPFRQGYASMSGPSKEFLNQVLGRHLHHGGHAVLRWNADNAVVLTDPAGNIKPDKAKSTQRIDGIVATIMALDRASRNEGGKFNSVYATRGVRVI